MVLNLKRATTISLVCVAAAHQAQAQPAARGRFGGGRAAAALSERLQPPGRGGPRPLLFGFALECVDCTRSDLASGAVPVWHYNAPPRVVAIAPNGSAENAGVRAGDLVTAIDGLSLLSEEGARRFSMVRIGDKIGLTVERDGRRIDLSLKLKRAVGALPALAPGGSDHLQYASRVGDTRIDVWGTEPVSSTVDSTGATILTIGTTTVRLSAANGPLAGRRGLSPRTP